MCGAASPRSAAVRLTTSSCRRTVEGGSRSAPFHAIPHFALTRFARRGKLCPAASQARRGVVRGDAGRCATSAARSTQLGSTTPLVLMTPTVTRSPSARWSAAPWPTSTLTRRSLTSRRTPTTVLAPWNVIDATELCPKVLAQERVIAEPRCVVGGIGTGHGEVELNQRVDLG